MYFVAFYADGTERTRRTYVLASTTTDATFGIYCRNLQRLRIISILWYHLDSTGRTVFGTVTALYIVGIDDTGATMPLGMTNLCRRLGFLGDRLDGAGRTNFGTLGTFRTAIATFVRHFGLHELHQIARRTEYLVRTYLYAQLAGSTVLGHVLGTERTERSDRGLAVWHFLVFDGSETTVHLLLYFLSHGSGSNQSGGRQEGTATGFGCSRWGLLFNLVAWYILDGTLLALVYTIEANYATAIVDFVVLRVDTRGLAILGTESATVTLGGIDYRLEVRVLGQETQYGTYRTDGVAIGTSIFPGKICQNHKSKDSYNESCSTFHPYLSSIECIAVGLFCKICQQVVSP